MKAIILAAGLGTRLRPKTDEVPKCMVEVNGIKIIQKQIDNLLHNKIKEDEILIVTGYKAEKLQEYLNENYQGINIVNNVDYNKTNNMYSMYLARNFVEGEPFIMMNADVFYEEDIIKELLEDKRENLIVCDDGRYIEESMKIIKEENKIIEISKKITEKEAYGVTIDVYKFSSEASTKFIDDIKEYIENKKDLNSWTEVAINDLVKKEKFESLDMKYKWVEIDNHDDLRQAEEIFK